jgi:uncharacterized protein (TIGR03435 family)
MSATLVTTLLMLGKVTIVLAIGLTAVWLARGGRAAVRHLLLAATFGVATAVPVVSLFVPAINLAVPMTIAPDTVAPDQVLTEAVATTRGDTVEMQTQRTRLSSPSASKLSAWSWVALAWIAGASLLLLPLMVGLRQMRSLRRSGLPWAYGQAVAESLAAEGKIGRRLDVLLHRSTRGPLTFGVVSPTILLPFDARAWSDDDLRRAIVHELEHVRRADWLTQCLGRIVCAGYWFHPLAWIAWRQFVIEAERACDDAVLRRSDATAYADQLVDLATRLSAGSRQPLLAMASRRDLSTRVRAVLNPDQQRGRAGAQSIGVAIAASIALLLVLSPLHIVAASQPSQAPTGPKPRYDLASIKPCDVEPVPTGARGAAGGTNASISPGRFQVPCVTTEQLIYLAYASYGVGEGEHLINDNPGSASDATKVRGGPEWVHSLKEKYQIEASAAGATERTVLMGTMLQSLLEDRFKLRLHRETEQVDMLELKVGKGGLKMTPMKDGDCEPNPNDGSRVDPAAKPRCGNINMMNSNLGVRWIFGGYKLSSLASMLSSNLKAHVIDSTGVDDKFVYRFMFQREDRVQTSADEQFQSRTVVGGGQPVPSLTAALDAIGLKLEKTKAPRGYLVIDHIERPTPNGPEVNALPPARAKGAGR